MNLTEGTLDCQGWKYDQPKMWIELAKGEIIKPDDQFTIHQNMSLTAEHGWGPTCMAGKRTPGYGLRYRRAIPHDMVDDPMYERVIPKPKPVNRKHFPMFTGFIKYFPRAARYCSHVSWKANEQHNPGEPMHWAKEKSADHADCLLRHMTDHETNPMDDDGLLHYGKALWRAAALLETYLEEHDEHDPTN